MWEPVHLGKPLSSCRSNHIQSEGIHILNNLEPHDKLLSKVPMQGSYTKSKGTAPALAPKGHPSLQLVQSFYKQHGFIVSRLASVVHASC
jgi:hypothetical protein